MLIPALVKHFENSRLQINFTIPLDFNLSKNKKFKGRSLKFLNPKYEKILSDIALHTQIYVSHLFSKQKLYVFINVFKPNHRGDASNFIDGICDGIKIATMKIGLDDNYFSGAWDWQIDKLNPRIEITIIQGEKNE